MIKLRNRLIGYILFFITTSFCVGSGILAYSFVINETKLIKFIVLFSTIIVVSLILVFCDYIRRRVMISGPLNEILDATKLMARGNFKIRLIPKHSYNEYDEFDLIKNDLNKMASELSKSEMLKNDFISNVSHEIKTPLSIIQNYVKLLSKDTLSEEEKHKYLDSLRKACDKLTNLVTNILKMNKLENQRLLIEKKRFNLSESLINQIVQYEELIQNKEIELVCDIEEDLYINSEESYLEIVWNNLISNAIKFTERKGRIDITLKKLENEYVMKITDTGCGIDNNTGKHIFDKFYQGDTSHSKEGNGLGLALVKKVIDVLGGRISVESEINKGTTFKVFIKE